jgi:hypothetical protein
VGRMTISFTSISAGCSMANAIVSLLARSDVASTSVQRHSDDRGTAFTARQRSDGKGQSDLRRQATLAMRIASCHISLFLEQGGLSERNWSATPDAGGSLMN